MSYRLGLLSEIELLHRDGAYWTFDLWAKDLEAQVEAIDGLTLFSPVLEQPRSNWGPLVPLPASIRVVELGRERKVMADEIARVDVVQIPGNQPWLKAGRSRTFLRLAHARRKPVVLGLSSDRARTQLINAAGHGLRKLRAWGRYAGIRLSQDWLASRADGVFVVGEGLRKRAESRNERVLVSTASWIRAETMAQHAPPRAGAEAGTVRLCVAARLEPMKGMHVALDALALLVREDPSFDVALDIAGVGPDEARLKALVDELGLQARVRFVGALAYPEPFFQLLRDEDVVLFTNLNDEQPRLIFDAISQGRLIVCPGSLPYRALGIPPELLYERGDARALADCILRASARRADPALHAELKSIARGATIENMHAVRRDWISATVLGRPAAA